MNIKVLLQAFNTIWYIEPNAAEHLSIVAHQILIGERKAFWDDDDDEEDAEEYAYVVDASGKRIGTVADAVDNGVAVINLKGAVMKYDYCGAPGTQSLINALQQANDNPAISGIVFQIDSPGGAVDGTEQLANAIKNSAKPVVAYINGMMCSAAMWIGSAASQRIASSSTDTIGSIGTMAKWNSYKPMYEKYGIKQHEVYATASTQKNLPFREAEGNNQEGKINYEPLIKTWLDPTNEVFMNAIQENLPAADNTVLSGAAYIAAEAKKKGLIDKIGSFGDAVNAALKLATQKQKTQPENNMKFSEKFPNLATALNISADINIADVTVDAFLQNSELLEAKLAENGTFAAEKAELNTSIVGLQSSVAELNQTNTTLAENNAALIEKNGSLETEITSLKAEVKEFNKDGAVGTTDAAGEDPKEISANIDPMAFAFEKEIRERL